MAVMPLVPETKMADVGKLISFGNLLVKKSHVVWAHNYVRNFDFVSWFWSRLDHKNCLYILSSFKNSLFQFRLTETTYPLSSSSQPHQIYTLCKYFLPCSTFTVRLAPASKTTTEISPNYRKKQTTNMGEDKFLQTYIIKILWCNGYRRRNWTRRYEFKSWTRLIAFHIALIPLGKVWIQLFSLQLWVNSRTD